MRASISDIFLSKRCLVGGQNASWPAAAVSFRRRYKIFSFDISDLFVDIARFHTRAYLRYRLYRRPRAYAHLSFWFHYSETFHILTADFLLYWYYFDYYIIHYYFTHILLLIIYLMIGIVYFRISLYINYMMIFLEYSEFDDTERKTRISYFVWVILLIFISF